METTAQARTPPDIPVGAGVRRSDPGSLLISFLAAAAVGMGFAVFSSRHQHWFLVPLVWCGGLVGADAIEWFRGRRGLFSPSGVIGLLGVHFFFLAPLLHVSWQYWMQAPNWPADWRDWLGGMAILNGFGLQLYRWSRSRIESLPVRQRSLWTADKRWFWPVLLTLLAYAAVTQAIVFAQFGGIGGYVEAFENVGSARENPFQGMGIVFTLSESAPILMLFAVSIGLKRLRQPSWTLIVTVLVVFVGVVMLFAGLRGSRSTIVWYLFWAAGVVHYTVRPLPRVAAFVGLVLMVIFLYLYGFYKSAGREALTAVQDAETRTGLEERTGRTMEATILGDLGRSDVHAILLYRMIGANQPEVSYAWGRTYLGAAALFIPRSVMPRTIAPKSKEGTEIVFGRGTFDATGWYSTKVYGLTGEAMLNFGPLVVPFALFLFGLAVGRLERFQRELRLGDLRLLILPWLASICIVVLSLDSDNVLFYMVSKGTIPTLVIMLGSAKHGGLRARAS